MDSLAKLAACNKVDPNEFDLSMNTLLVAAGAEKYVDIFRRHNIGQFTLMELTEDDLIKLGIDDPLIRKKLMDEVKNLPLYEVNLEDTAINTNLTFSEITEVLEESSQHLYRIQLSLLTSILAIKKTKNITDCLLYKDKYSSDISLATLSEINTILNSMDIALHTKFKVYAESKNSLRKKKIVVGTVGSFAVAFLAVMFVQSLKRL